MILRSPRIASESPQIEGRGDLDPAVLLYGCVTRKPQHEMCWLSSEQGTTKSSRAYLASIANNVPTTSISRTPRPSRRPDARASKRPPVNGGSSVRRRWENEGKLRNRVRFATMAGGESPGLGRQPPRRNYPEQRHV